MKGTGTGRRDIEREKHIERENRKRLYERDVPGNMKKMGRYEKEYDGPTYGPPALYDQKPAPQEMGTQTESGPEPEPAPEEIGLSAPIIADGIAERDRRKDLPRVTKSIKCAGFYGNNCPRGVVGKPTYKKGEAPPTKYWCIDCRGKNDVRNWELTQEGRQAEINPDTLGAVPPPPVLHLESEAKKKKKKKPKKTKKKKPKKSKKKKSKKKK